MRPGLKRPQRLTVKPIYLVVTWDHGGYLTKTWIEGKANAERDAESMRDDWHNKSVAGPIGPFRLVTAKDPTRKGT